jgi:hypothetical protein
MLNRYGLHFPEVKRSGREVSHSPLSSADVKNEWLYSCSHISKHDIDRDIFGCVNFLIRSC